MQFRVPAKLICHVYFDRLKWKETHQTEKKSDPLLPGDRIHLQDFKAVIKNKNDIKIIKLFITCIYIVYCRSRS